MEGRVRDSLTKLDGELAGTYKSLSEMSYDERNALIEEHILYNDADDKFDFRIFYCFEISINSILFTLTSPLTYHSLIFFYFFDQWGIVSLLTKSFYVLFALR